MSKQPKRYRHKKTGTIYAVVQFHETHPRLATVVTVSGSQYIVKAVNLEEVES